MRQLVFVSRHPTYFIMAHWQAVVKINNRLFRTPFESLSNFGADAKAEAIGRYGTEDIQLFPSSKRQ